MSDDEELPIKPQSKSIKVNHVGSLLDFRTIVLQQTRKANSLGTQTVPLVNKTKKNLFVDPVKEEKKARKDEKLSKKRIEEARKDEEELRRRDQRRKMEEKSRLYDRLKKGEQMVYEDGTKPEFLVDFDRRSRSRSPVSTYSKNTAGIGYDYNNPSSNYVNEPGPSVPQQSEVYYNPTEEKDRVFGASHIILPQETEERQKKINELMEASLKTAEARVKFKKQKTDEQKAEKAKINFMRQLAGKSKSPLPSSEDEDEQHPGANINLNEIPLPPDPEEVVRKEEERKKKFVREWDKGKVRNMEWIKEQRDVRDEEFRPPDFY